MFSRKGKLGESWYSDFYYEGKRYKKAWGRVPKTIAKKKERKFYNDIVSGEYASQKNKIEFEPFILNFLKNVKKEKKFRTYIVYLNSAKAWMCFLRGKELQVIKSKGDDKYETKKIDGVKEKITYLSELDSPFLLEHFKRERLNNRTYIQRYENWKGKADRTYS